MSFCLTLNRDNPSYFPTYNMFRIWNKIVRKNRNVEIQKRILYMIIRKIRLQII